jgi:hypothetical protein
VRVMLAQMTSAELAEWMAYFMLGEAEGRQRDQQKEIADLKASMSGKRS